MVRQNSGLTDAAGEVERLAARLEQLERERQELRRECDEAEQRFRTLLDYAPEGIVLLDVETGRFLDANPVAEQIFGLTRSEMLQVGPFALSPESQPDGPSDERGRAYIQRAVEGQETVFEWWHQNARGERFPAEVRLVRMPWGERDVIRGSILDISGRKQIELSERARSRMLERIERGAALPEVLGTVIATIEEVLPGLLCSILLLDRETRRLHLGAAPSLPDFYNEAVDGLEIGPEVGCCGAAAHRRERVVAEDVLTHPHWAAYRELAARAGLRACWSEPIFSLDRETLGTLAMYYREPRSPGPLEIQLIIVAARLARTAIEHDASRRVLRDMNVTLERRVEEKTRELTTANDELRLAEQDQRLAAVAFQTHDSILITDAGGTILRVNESFTAMTGYTAAEVIGKTPGILKSGCHGPDFYHAMWDAIRQEGHWDGMVWNRRKDGRIYPQQLSITAVRDASGEITHYVGDGRDISQQRQAEADRAAIDVARKVQEDLFPLHPPSLPGWDLAAAVFPAERVSGDYYDFLPLGQTGLGLVVADVSGHGLGPALLMAQTQAYLRALADRQDDPGEILTGVNRLFSPRDDGRFVTMFLACLDVESRRVRYAGAGHQGYVIDPAGRVKTLSATGLPLGVVRDAPIATSQALTLPPEHILLLTTDGCEESIGPGQQLFGRPRMFDIVRATRHESSAEIVRALHTAVRDFSQGLPQNDDVTLVVLKGE